MSDRRKTIEELRAAIKTAEREHLGKVLKHRKSGAIYFVMGFQYHEADMVIEFRYVGAGAVMFSRPVSELTDDRYEVIGNYMTDTLKQREAYDEHVGAAAGVI